MAAENFHILFSKYLFKKKTGRRPDGGDQGEFPAEIGRRAARRQNGFSGQRAHHHRAQRRRRPLGRRRRRRCRRRQSRPDRPRQRRRVPTPGNSFFYASSFKIHPGFGHSIGLEHWKFQVVFRLSQFKDSI